MVSTGREVLIIAGPNDGVAFRLREALEEQGKRVAQVDGLTAARLFTIRVGPDATAVTPAVPLFVRASAWWCETEPIDSDEHFLRAEAYSGVWAAAALSPARVINRPGRNGALGRLTAGEIAYLLSTRNGSGSSEFHASGPEMLKAADESLWGEDSRFVIAPVGELRRGFALRARKLNPCALYEIVTVVGERAFAATSDPRTSELELPKQSIDFAKRLDLHFATVTWAIDDTGAKPIRLNSSPEEGELHYAWSEVAKALCEDLLA